jgi:polar amino acid transport system permease protein
MPNLMVHVPLLLQGLQVTLQIFVCGCLVAMTFAVVAGVIRFQGPTWLRIPTATLVEFLRGTSAFVQLFWCFFALPLLGVRLSPFVASVLVLGLNVGSFGSEVVRGALEAVPKGQVEAAKSLNYTPFACFIHVQLPQALRIVIGPAANLMVDLLKLTPLTSLVTVSELTRSAMVMRTQIGSTAVTLTCIFVIYFILASLIYWGMGRLEKGLFRRSSGAPRQVPA